jgi:hypothetical protein
MSASAATPRQVLRLNRELYGLILWHLILGPKAIQQLETQVASKRFFDHLAVTLAHASGTHLHQFENFFIQSYCRADLWHLYIIAS